VVLATARRTSDGRIDVVVGQLDPVGRLDSSFGANGTVRTLFGSASCEPNCKATTAALATGVVVQDDAHRLVVAGNRRDGLRWIPALVGLDDAGKRDGSFGTRGLTTLPFPRAAQMTVLTPSFAGRIALAGVEDEVGRTSGLGQQSYEESYVFARVSKDGRPDKTLGGTGRGCVNWSDYDVVTVGGALTQPDGGLVIAGAAGDSSDGDVQNTVVIKTRRAFGPWLGCISTTTATKASRPRINGMVSARARLALKLRYARYIEKVHRLVPSGPTRTISLGSTAAGIFHRSWPPVVRKRLMCGWYRAELVARRASGRLLTRRLVPWIVLETGCRR
jgi:hypothetical protein